MGQGRRHVLKVMPPYCWKATSGGERCQPGLDLVTIRLVPCRQLQNLAEVRRIFIAVETGITGTTDIGVLKGLKNGDEIVTGSYKVLRTMRPGAGVNVDNTAPKKEEGEGS